MRRVFTSLLILIFAAVLLFGAALWWLHHPMPLRLQPGAQVVDLEIEPGTSADGVAEAVVASGANVPVLMGSVEVGKPNTPQETWHNGAFVIDPAMASGVARISIAAVAGIGFVLVIHLATHGYDRAVMLVPSCDSDGSVSPARCS